MRAEGAIGKGYKLVIKDILLTIRALLVTAMWFVIAQCILTVGITAHLNGKHFLDVLKYLSMYKFQSDMHLVGDVLSYLLDETVKIFIYTQATWGLFPLVIYMYGRKFKKHAETEHVRGTEVIPEKQLARLIEHDERCRIRISEQCKLPVKYETQHGFIVGMTGTGKTTEFLQFIRQVKVGFRGIIFEAKEGDYMRFFDPQTDFLFNPFSPDCVKWSIFNEIQKIYDLNAIGKALIPDSANLSGTETYFRTAARDMFTGILSYLQSEGKTTNKDLWDCLILLEEEIIEILKKTEDGRIALRHLEKQASGQSAGVISTFTMFTACFKFIRDLHGDFSFREWIRNGKGWIFIQSSQGMKDAVMPLLSLVTDILCKEMLSLPNTFDENVRTFFFVDELGALNKLPSLVDFLTLSRSKGGSMWIGIQDFGRIRELYGKDIAETIYNNTAMHLAFRVQSPQTAAYISQSFGDRDTREMDDTAVINSGENPGGSNTRKTKRHERAIIEGDIVNLEEHHGYLKMGKYPVAKVHIPRL